MKFNTNVQMCKCANLCKWWPRRPPFAQNITNQLPTEQINKILQECG